MDAQGMQSGVLVGQLHDPMQDAATGAREDGNINVFPTDKRIHAQNRVTVIPFAINGVATVGEMRPGFVGEVFEVWLVGI